MIMKVKASTRHCRVPCTEQFSQFWFIMDFSLKDSCAFTNEGRSFCKTKCLTSLSF